MECSVEIASVNTSSNSSANSDDFNEINEGFEHYNDELQVRIN